MGLNVIQDKSVTFDQLLGLNQSQEGGVCLTPHIGNLERRHFVWMKQGPVYVYNLNASDDAIYTPSLCKTGLEAEVIYGGSPVLTPYAQIDVLNEQVSNMAYFHFKHQSMIDSVNFNNFTKLMVSNSRVLQMYDVFFSQIKSRKLKTLFKKISVDGSISNSCSLGGANWMNCYLDGMTAVTQATENNLVIDTDVVWAPNLFNILSACVMSVDSSTSDVYLLSGRTMYDYVLGLLPNLNKYWGLLSSHLDLSPELNLHVIAGTGMNLATQSTEVDLRDLIDTYLETGCGFSDLKQMMISRQPMSQYDYLSLGQPDLQLSEFQRSIPLSVLSELEAVLKSS